MMNTLHKSLTITILAVSFIILGISADFVGAQATASDLPPAEIPQRKYIRFGHLTSEDGLSNSTAWGLMQDSQGYIWISTFDGLNRYDGYNFTVFKNDPEDSGSISSSFTYCAVEDAAGTIWVCTDSGLNKFDQDTERFVRYAFDPSAGNSTVQAVYEDLKGRLWIGSSHGILYQFDRSIEKLIPVSSNKEFGRILSIQGDQEGNLWIGDSRGLTRFDSGTGKFIQYQPNPYLPDSLNDNQIQALHIADDQSKKLVSKNKIGEDSDLKSEIRNPKSEMEGIAIIAITASAFREQRQDIMAAGCNDMVIKPFRAHEIFEAMGRFLDIEYIYEPEREAAPARVRDIELTADMLADLPDELLQKLRKTSLSLDRQAISGVVDRIEPLAPDIAKDLRTLLNDYQMGRIRDLIGDIG